MTKSYVPRNGTARRPLNIQSHVNREIQLLYIPIGVQQGLPPFQTRSLPLRPDEASTSLINRLLLEQQLETKRFKRNTFADEMFAHCLDPVETERVQHGTCTFHDTQDGDGEDEPEKERDDDHEYLRATGRAECISKRHTP